MSALVAILLCAAAPAELRELEEKLARERAAAEELARKEAGLLGKLAALERLVDVEGRALKAAQARLRQGSARLEAGERQLQAVEEEVTRATKALTPRLVARYKLGREGYLRFLLGARSLADVLRRRKLFAALLKNDFEALESLKLWADHVRAARDELASARGALEGAARAEADRRRALEARIADQQRLLAALQEEKAAHDQAVRELEESAKSLAGKLGEIGREPAAAPDQAAGAPVPFKKLRGKLLFPVENGRVEVRFGRRTDLRFGTVTLQRGIDVRAPAGEPVRAVHGGRVVHSGWFRGYGNLVIVDHGEGYYSLMAHLADLLRGVGDEVKAGDVVGTVGDSGSLKGAYLHFELREGQKPLDPLRWLSRKRKPGPVATKQAGG